MIGNTVTLDGRNFEVLKQIGKGKGGYSYLARSEDGLCVLKKMHYEPNDTYQFEDNKLGSELRDYKTLTGAGVPMPRLLHVNMDEQFLIKEYIDGPTLSEIVAKGLINDGHILQLFSMCDRLYAAGLNVDYFPPNFVERDGRLFYVDYECNLYMEEWDFEHWGIWFLANTDGMARFLETGDHSFLSTNAKPHKEGFGETVGRWLNMRPVKRPAPEQG